MLIVRLLLSSNEICYGQMAHEGAGEVELLDGNPIIGQARTRGQTLPCPPSFAAWQSPQDPTGEPVPQLLVPVEPSKIIGVGSNYHNHTVEMGKPIPKEPILFFKPPSALLAPGKAIRRPPFYTRVDYEGELAVVVKHPIYRVAEDDIERYLFGYCALNDVTVRELQKQDGQFTRAKGMDTFCPLGPAIQTDLSHLSPGRFVLKTYLNSKEVQDSGSDRFLFSVPRLLSFISHFMTLVPGDVITTGTPAGVGNLSPGDVVEIALCGLPVLRNPVTVGDEPFRLA